MTACFVEFWMRQGASTFVAQDGTFQCAIGPFTMRFKCAESLEPGKHLVGGNNLPAVPSP